jgi:hypothetical protein
MSGLWLRRRKLVGLRLRGQTRGSFVAKGPGLFVSMPSSRTNKQCYSHHVADFQPRKITNFYAYNMRIGIKANIYWLNEDGAFLSCRL